MVKKVSLITCFCIIATMLTAQKLPLDGKWKYTLNDSIEYAEATYNDAGWTSVDAKNLYLGDKVPEGKNNTRWYRKAIVIPSSLKSVAEKTGLLVVYLPNVDGEDLTFFNGKLIGKTSDTNLGRAYLFKASDILWDKENTIVIKVVQWLGLGSLIGIPYIDASTPELLVEHKLDSHLDSKMDPLNKSTNYALHLENKSPKPLQAIVKASFYDIHNVELYTSKKEVTLLPTDNQIDFNYNSVSPFLKVIYTLELPQFSYIYPGFNAIFGCENVKYQSVKPIVVNKISEHFQPAAFNEQIIKGWLGTRIAANKEQRLYNVDEKGLLAGYINRPGVQDWIGEHVGKFLDAASNTYANKADAKLKIQMDRMAQQLIATQLNDGYLGTYTKERHWVSWDVWNHKYNLVGLLSYYSVSGYKPALVAAEKVGNLLCQTFGTNNGQLDIIKAGEHIGMAATSILDPMTDLYRFTGNAKYLDFCNYIIKSYEQPNGSKIISSLNTIGQVDKTANAKAYEMLSNLVGMIKLYKITGDQQLLQPVLNAWTDIVAKRLYISGATSSFEHFKGDHLLPAGEKDNVGEGCVSTTWIQLNYQLFSLYGTTAYLDELERTVYNQLTAAENPQTGCVSYFTPLMGVKSYGCNITCCLSSVPRGISMIPQFVNGTIDGNPSFLFYQPGIYTTRISNKDKTLVSFITTTDFLKDSAIEIEVNPTVKSKFSIAFRKPYWVGNFKLFVNNVKQETVNSDIVLVHRVWNVHDKITIKMSLPIKVLDGGISYPNAVALQRGPQILTFDQSLHSVELQKIVVSPINIKLTDVKNKLPNGWIGTQCYQLPVSIDGKATSIMLVPFADASQTGGKIETWFKK
ncbi:MAG: glycoside hydrolase family 127 protein [Bacteroidetes bacterium]|nr:glycoside hydrolase family 127 protein [Bacteroidota bacterium]